MDEEDLEEMRALRGKNSIDVLMYFFAFAVQNKCSSEKSKREVKSFNLISSFLF